MDEPDHPQIAAVPAWRRLVPVCWHLVHVWWRLLSVCWRLVPVHDCYISPPFITDPQQGREGDCGGKVVSEQTRDVAYWLPVNFAYLLLHIGCQ